MYYWTTAALTGLSSLSLTFQLVSEDNFEVQRRACVELDLGKFMKKSWQKGLSPDSISVLAGKTDPSTVCRFDNTRQVKVSAEGLVFLLLVLWGADTVL